MRERVTVICAGHRDASLLTVRAADALRRADAIVVDAELAETAREHADAACEVLVVPDEKSLAQRTRISKDAVRRHSSIVRLIAGDSVLDGMLANELRALEAIADIVVVPGLTSAVTAASFGGFSLTGMRTREVRIVEAADPGVNWSVTSRELLIVKGAGQGAARVLRLLQDAGCPSEMPFRIVTGIATPNQRTIAGVVGDGANASDLAGLGLDTVIFIGEPVRDAVDWFERLPLFGWNVLLPRTKDSLESLTESLSAAGATTTAVATLSVEPPRTPQQMEKAVAGLAEGRFGWVIFTSANSFDAVWQRCEDFGLDARAFAGTRIAAVGSDTVDALCSRGLRADLAVTTEATTMALLEEFPEAEQGLDLVNRVLIPRADLATETLAAGLVELGWEIEEVTAFRTVRSAPPSAGIRDAIKSGGFDAVVFTSSATVRNLIGLAGKPHADTIVACIGPSTARTAEELGLRVDAIAAEPTHASVSRALIDVALSRAGAGVARPCIERKTKLRSRPRAENTRSKAT